MNVIYFGKIYCTSIFWKILGTVTVHRTAPGQSSIKMQERLLDDDAPPRRRGTLPQYLLAAFAGTVLLVLAASAWPGANRVLLLGQSRPNRQSGPNKPRNQLALVNFIRHGERDQNPLNTGLTVHGKLRAEYLGRCIGSAMEPSLAFPLGPPTALLGSVHYGQKVSTRPADTLQPIQDVLRLSGGVELASGVNVSHVERRVQRLQPGETLLVAWQHDYIPELVNALHPPAPKILETFPSECNSTHFQEPAYTLNDPGGSCYDVLWQVVLQRPEPKELDEAAKRWHAVSLTQLHQGFAGEGAHGTDCREALAPLASESALFRETAVRKWREGDV